MTKQDALKIYQDLQKVVTRNAKKAVENFHNNGVAYWENELSAKTCDAIAWRMLALYEAKRDYNIDVMQGWEAYIIERRYHSWLDNQVAVSYDIAISLIEERAAELDDAE